MGTILMVQEAGRVGTGYWVKFDNDPQMLLLPENRLRKLCRKVLAKKR